jgi:hypothetical protein
MQVVWPTRGRLLPLCPCEEIDQNAYQHRGDGIAMSSGCDRGDLDDIPPGYRERFIEIATRTEDFCAKHLNGEYADVCRRLAHSMCDEDSPVLKGKAASWACGIVYAAGRVNFLTDPSQDPHLTADQIAKRFGVSPATMHAKYRAISDGLDLIPLDPDFTIASRMESNPLIWMLQVNGLLVDIRACPREAQVVAYEQGLIPYFPADRA